MAFNRNAYLPVAFAETEVVVMKPLESHHIIRIDSLEVSRENCTITAGEQEIKVSPRSMDVLVYLDEHRGRVVSPEELLDQFWSSLASDHAVHKAIAELRAAMGDSVRQQKYIKTVPKRGYKLVALAPVAEPAVSAPARPLSVPVQGLGLAGWRQLALFGVFSAMLVGLGMLVESRREAAASVVVVESAPLCRINTGTEGYLLLVSVVQTDAGSAQPARGFGLRRGDLEDSRDLALCAAGPLMDATGG